MNRAPTSRIRRPLAVLVGGVLTLGVAAALPTAAAADPDRRHARYERSDHRYDRHSEHARYERHRYDRHRHDRHRYDRHRDRHRYDRHRYDRHRYDRHRYDRRRGRVVFEVPRAIHRHRDYARYAYDRVYFRPHRHHHRIYRFPVVYRGYRTYAPYAYCEGRYFSRGAFYYDGPRLSIRWRF